MSQQICHVSPTAASVQEAELIIVERELENLMLSDEDYLERASKDVVLPALTCPACNGFYRGPVRYCRKSHGVCALCFPGMGKKCPAGVCSEMYGEVTVTTGHQAELVKEYGLKVDCKYKKDGCGRKGIVQDIEDHEADCPERLIACLMACTDFWQRAKDYEAHVGGHHQEFTARAGGWWFAQYFHPALGYRQGAHTMWVDPQTGLSFSAVLKQEATFWSCFVMVYGGRPSRGQAVTPSLATSAPWATTPRGLRSTRSASSLTSSRPTTPDITSSGNTTGTKMESSNYQSLSKWKRRRNRRQLTEEAHLELIYAKGNMCSL